MHFIRQRKWFYIFSSTLIICGIISMVYQGFNPGIDFTGGTMLRYKMTGTVEAGQVETVVVGLKVAKEVTVQKSQDEFFIRTSELDQQKTAAVTAALTEKFGKVEMMSAESVGGLIGKELTMNALLAILLALALMLAYITFRFELSYGIAAVLALFHDVLIILSIYSIFQWEVNSAFIAAILTIIGYSITDTIVIFDRVRENQKNRKKDELGDLLNKSIYQTLTRSVNTVLTVLMPLIMLLLFGGDTLKGFVLTLLIGFMFGMYSSICVASPLYFEMKNRAQA